MPMTLDKAYEILTLPISEDTKATIFDLHDAQRIGAEALMAVKSFRTGQPTPALWRLPGEAVI